MHIVYSVTFSMPGCRHKLWLEKHCLGHFLIFSIQINLVIYIKEKYKTQRGQWRSPLSKAMTKLKLYPGTLGLGPEYFFQDLALVVSEVHLLALSTYLIWLFLTVHGMCGLFSLWCCKVLNSRTKPHCSWHIDSHIRRIQSPFRLFFFS